MCDKCGQHRAVVNRDGQLLCGTCSVISGFEPPSTLNTQHYRSHAEKQTVKGNLEQITVEFCTCARCIAFRRNYPSLAARIEAGVFQAARRSVLLMVTSGKKGA